MTPQRYKGFFAAFLATLCVSLMVIAATNAIVDPEGRFDLLDATGFNAVKTSQHPRNRSTKALSLVRCDYRYVMLGSSRAETGLSPDYAGFGGASVLNAGLPNIAFEELLQTIRFTVEHQQSPVLIIGLDHGIFENTELFPTGYEHSRLAPSISLESTIRYLLYKESLKASVKTVRDNLAAAGDRCSHNGMHDVRDVPVNQKEAFEQILEGTENRYRSGVFAEGRVGEFAELLKFLADENIETHLYITPVHAHQHALADKYGVLHRYTDWKHELVTAIAELNGGLPEERHFRLWDFGRINALTTEPVPADPETQMRWWRDSHHVRVAAGNLILSHVLDYPGEEAESVSDLGVILTEANIDRFNRQFVAAVARFRETLPAWDVIGAEAARK